VSTPWAPSAYGHAQRLDDACQDSCPSASYPRIVTRNVPTPLTWALGPEAVPDSRSVFNFVRETGVEPARLAALEPKSSASANSATRAFGRPHLNGGEAAVLAPRAENVSGFAEAGVASGMVGAVRESGHPAPRCAVLDGGWGFV
jgi:hypothetical protein